MSLFIINLSLLAVGLLLNIPWRQWQLVAFYALMLALFHVMYFDIGPSLAGGWYARCILTQSFMGIAAVFVNTKATRVVLISSALAVLVNAVKWYDYDHARLIDHQLYYIAINVLQSAQIGSFLILTPLWPFLWKRLRRKPQTRSEPWQTRQAVTRL